MLDASRETGNHARSYLRNANVRWFGFDLADLAQMDFSEQERKKFALRPGDVLVCEGGEPGRAAVWTEPIADCYFQKALHRVRLDRSKCLPEYFVRAMRAEAANGGIARLATSATIAHLTRQKLIQLRLPLPPVDEQRKIADVLDRADSLRAKRREALNSLDELIESILDSTLNGLPVARRVAVGEVAVVRIGPFGSLLHKEDYVSGGVPLVNPMHILDGRIRPASTVSVTAAKFEALRSYELQVGDVVMGRRGEIGRCAEVRGDEGLLLCGTGSMLIRPRPERALPAYLAALFRSRPVVERLTRMAKGTTMLNLNSTILAGLEVDLPCIETQQGFVRATTVIGDIRAREAAHLDLLDELFASLQQRAFRGDLFSSPLPAELADAVA